MREAFAGLITEIGGLIGRVRPNILMAMLIVASLGVFLSFLGYKLGNTELMSGVGIGAVVLIGNLAMKILEKE